MKHILITGASSGLGAALALAYAAPDVRLSLCARSEQRLASTANAARAKGATVEETLLDVRQTEQVKAWLVAAAKAAPLDLVIVNAGVSAGTGSGGESIDQLLEIIDINVKGALQTALLAASVMKEGKQGGQIVLLSSLAGFRGLAGAPAYGASRAATRLYGEALRLELAPDGIKVNVVCPGFVATPMTAANGFAMPFLMSPQRAVQIIQRGIEKNKARISFPWPMALLVWLLSLLPVGLTDPLLARLPKKP